MTDDTGTAAHFDSECWRIHREAQAASAAYKGSWFEGQLKSVGGLAVAKRMLATTTIQSGFTDMVAAGHHELTIEYLATRSVFTHLFTAAELAEARRRLGGLAAS